MSSPHRVLGAISAVWVATVPLVSATAARPGPIEPLATLERQLASDGWTLLLTRSNAYAVGDIVGPPGRTLQVAGPDCFELKPRVSDHESLGFGRAFSLGASAPPVQLLDGRAGRVKSITVSSARVHQVPRLDLSPTAACQERLSQLTPARRGGMAVVQAVLVAEVVEQQCVDVSVGARAFRAGMREQCVRTAPHAVAVALKTIPVAALEAPRSPPPPAAPPPSVDRAEPSESPPPARSPDSAPSEAARPEPTPARPPAPRTVPPKPAPNDRCSDLRLSTCGADAGCRVALLEEAVEACGCKPEWAAGRRCYMTGRLMSEHDVAREQAALGTGR